MAHPIPLMPEPSSGPERGKRDAAHRWRIFAIAGSAMAVFLVHAFLPVGPPHWHVAHLIAQEIFYLPIILAAAWQRFGALLLTTAAVSLLFAYHDLTAWRGFALIQQTHAAQIASYWAAAAVAWWLFEQRRQAQRNLQGAHQETLAALARSLELRERSTEGHSERVRAYTLLLAKQMGVHDPARLEVFALGAFLHDIGKIGIPDAILLKRGALTEAEWAVMRRHPSLGASLIGTIPFLAETQELVLAHHERFDGRGYPAGLSGEAIPFGARIFAVADTFDALTTFRPYRSASTYTDAARIIAQEEGGQFDPSVVRAFLAVPSGAWMQALPAS